MSDPTLSDTDFKNMAGVWSTHVSLQYLMYKALQYCHQKQFSFDQNKLAQQDREYHWMRWTIPNQTSKQLVCLMEWEYRPTLRMKGLRIHPKEHFNSCVVFFAIIVASSFKIQISLFGVKNSFKTKVYKVRMLSWLTSLRSRRPIYEFPVHFRSNFRWKKFRIFFYYLKRTASKFQRDSLGVIFTYGSIL